jgi:hypothetical protein
MKRYESPARGAKAPKVVVVAAALGLLGLGSCGQAAPEGATLRLQFQGVRVAAIDAVRISFTPQLMQRFTMRPTQMVDGITIEVDPADGALLMNVPGDYVRAHAVETDSAGLSPQLDIEMWSDDATENPEPLVRVTVTQGSDLIAQGSAYTMGWPIDLGSISTVNVMCTTGALMQCQRM